MSEQEPQPTTDTRLERLNESELVEFIERPITPEAAAAELTRRLGARGLSWFRTFNEEEGETVHITPVEASRP